MLKKILLFVLVILIFPICRCDSQQKTDIKTVMRELCALQSETKGVMYCRETAGEEDFFVLDEDNFGRLYSGKFAPPVCIDRINDYTVRLPVDDSGYEIHIIECLNRSDVGEVADMLRQRTEKIQNSEILEYAPENFEKYFRGATVLTYGRYAVLLATPDNEAAEKLLKKLL